MPLYNTAWRVCKLIHFRPRIGKEFTIFFLGENSYIYQVHTHFTQTFSKHSIYNLLIQGTKCKVLIIATITCVVTGQAPITTFGLADYLPLNIKTQCFLTTDRIVAMSLCEQQFVDETKCSLYLRQKKVVSTYQIRNQNQNRGEWVHKKKKKVGTNDVQINIKRSRGKEKKKEVKGSMTQQRWQHTRGIRGLVP